MPQTEQQEPHIYSIGTTEMYGSTGSWVDEYWLQPSEDGSEWTVWMLGEEMDERQVKDTYPAADIFQVVTEELGIDVITTESFIELEYAYTEKTIHLFVLKVTDFSGEPKGIEGQRIEWISSDKLSSLEFPDANYPILEKLLGLLI